MDTLQLKIISIWYFYKAIPHLPVLIPENMNKINIENYCFYRRHRIVNADKSGNICSMKLKVAIFVV